MSLIHISRWNRSLSIAMTYFILKPTRERLRRKKMFYLVGMSTGGISFFPLLSSILIGVFIYTNFSTLILSRWVILFSSCRLCEKDPFQLYQRLEQQAREYVLEMKVRLLKHLSSGPKTAGSVGTVAAVQGPPQAYQFISLLLEEYSALCQAARTISSFLLTLVSSPLDSENHRELLC